MNSRSKRILQLALSNQPIVEKQINTNFSLQNEENSNLHNFNNYSIPLETTSKCTDIVTTSTDAINPSKINPSEILYTALQNSFLISDEFTNNDLSLSSSVDNHNPQILTAVVFPSRVEDVEITIEDHLENTSTEITEKLLTELGKEPTDQPINTGDANNLKHFNKNISEKITENVIPENGNDLIFQFGNNPNSKDENKKITADENKQKRRRKSNKEEWSRQKTKVRRMTGQDYVGYTRNKKGEISHNKKRSAREMGPACQSSKCLKYKNRFCNSISEAERKIIFSKFWEDMSWDQKKIYVTSLMEVKPTGRKYVENSRRTTTYFLKIGNEKKQVCKAMFLATLGLKEWMVTNWCQNTVNGILPSTNILNIRKSNQRNSVRKRNTQEQEQYLHKFFEDLPKMPSHYCRKDTRKQYLEYNFESKANLYGIYKKKCISEQRIPLSYWSFSETFENLKLAIFIPKKDQCNICVAFKAGNVEEISYNRHIILKDLAREHKNADTAKSKQDICHVFVMDVQAVKMCPVNNANKFYFKTRLKLHNFTIYNLKNHECCNYWWSEVEGNLCSSVFATIIIDHLYNYCQDNLPIIIWSDGCPYQNRNVILSNALLQYAVQEKKTVIQKYLEPGHTQMECDAVHSLIERKLKNKEIVMPYDYVRITREARQKPSPLIAQYMTHDKFRNYDDKNIMRYKSIRPGRSTRDPTVTDLREIHYFPNGKIGFKINFDEEIKELPQRTKEVLTHGEPSRLFQSQLNITKQKFEDLQEIKTTLEPEFHSFYDSLKYE